MAKCYKCEKYDALDTWRDKLFTWLCRSFFPEQLIELSQEKYGRGFGAGYKTGFEHASSEFKPDMSKMWPKVNENAKKTKKVVE